MRNGSIGEYNKHSATIAMFPIRTDIWRDGAVHMQHFILDLVRIISKYEKVILVYPKNHTFEVINNNPNIQVVFMDYDDIWARDIGPSFVMKNGRLECIDWTFNAWGGKEEGSYYPWDSDDEFASNIASLLHLHCFRSDVVLEGGAIITDGKGTLFTTENVLLNKNRNPNVSKEEIENRILMATGDQRIVWLESGLATDETNGHIDNMVSFINANELCLSWTDDPNNPNYDSVRSAYKILKNTISTYGNPYVIYKIPLPPMQYMTEEEANGLTTNEDALSRLSGDPLPASYLNFYMINGAVLIPSFGCEEDIIVKEKFTALFPNLEIVQIYCREPLLGGGGIHCLLHEIPDVKYSPLIESYVSSKVEIRSGSIDNIGMFAKEKILAGEIVYIKGGHILTKENLYYSKIINSYLPISDNYYLGALTDEEEDSIKLYNNHSCDPNCGLHGEITFVAIRDIEPNEELTVDYAFIDNEDYTFECHCGSPKCRHIVTGYDWKKKEIQDKYYQFFAQYLKDKIDQDRSQ